MNILMLGVQASGKGTQAKMLAEKLKLPHVSSGDLFRDLDMSTPLGKEVRGFIDKGNLVPDDVTFRVIKERLDQRDCQAGVILDGFPRTLNQARQLENLLKLDHAVHLEISDQEALKRISGRRICKKCNISYNIYTEPKPQKNSLCDKCGSKLIQRVDEKESAVRKRIDTYHEQTSPLIEYYKDKGMLVAVDGHRSIEEVHHQILQKLQVNP